MYRFERQLKWLSLMLGIASTIAIVQNWYPYTMYISLPFCLIWAYCGWLRTEPQLKWVNILFCALYGYGIIKYFLSLG